MRQWGWKVWGAILGGLIVIVAGWLGVIAAVIVIAGAVIGLLIGAVIDGDLGLRIRRGR